MPPSPQSPPSRAWVAVLLAMSPALLAVTLVAPWPWLAPALGRLHPVVLHFPIAFLLLAGLTEGLHVLSRGRWVFPQRFLLFVGASAAVVAAASGYLLMRGDDVQGALVERHFYGGLAVAVLAVAVFALRLTAASEAPGKVRWIFRAGLAALCGLIGLVAHDGGSLTHGEDYLTEKLPWFQAAAPKIAFPQDRPPGQWEAYAHTVSPILEVRCIACHRSSGFKGKLILDSWDALLKGGASGPLFVAGQPGESQLIQRLLLPMRDKKHMPPANKPQLTAGEIALLRRWVAAGAPAQGTLASLGADQAWLAEAGGLPKILLAAAALPAAPVEVELDAAAVAKLRAPLAAKVAELQRRYPGAIAYISRQTGDLHINVSVAGASFGDADLVALAPLQPVAIELDLSGTGITDACAGTLGAFSRLKRLRLARTAVTDRIAPALGRLAALESLSLYATKVTDEAADMLRQLPKLRRLQAEETGMSAEVRASWIKQ